MKRDYITRFLYTLIISVIICMVMSVVFFDSQLTIGLVLRSMGLGIAIWLISELTFDTILKKWPHNILPSYIALFIIIAIGTGIGSWLLGVTSLWILVLICLCAEVFGFLITVAYRQSYMKKLNAQLEKYKRARTIN